MELFYKKYELNLKRRFSISRSSASQKNILYVGLKEKHDFGMGEVSPYPHYGQTLDLAQEGLEALRPVFKKWSPPQNIKMIQECVQHIETLLYSVDSVSTHWNHLIHALSSSLLDIAARSQKVSVSKFLIQESLLNKYFVSPPTSFTLGIDQPEVMIEKLKEADAFSIIKVKVGQSYEEDTKNLEVLFQTSPHKIFRVDANCGWDLETTQKMLHFLKNHKVDLIEQPLNESNIQKLTQVPSSIPFILDESFVNYEDIDLAHKVAQGINLKMSKCGGIFRGLKIIHQAREKGLKIMLGGMIESSLGLAPAHHLSGLVDFVDLDGNLLISNDPFEGEGHFYLKEGRFHHHEKGLGWGLHWLF